MLWTALPVILAAILTAVPTSGRASDNDETGEFLARFGGSSSGQEVRDRIQDAMKETRKALEEKKKSGALDEDEQELLDNLGDFETSLREIDPSELEGLARLASGGSVEVVPDEEEAAAGMRPVTITAADLVRAQEDAVRLSEAAEAFSRSPEAKALEAVAAAEEESASSGASSGASWRNASRAGSGGGSSGGRGGVGEVTAVAATSATFPSGVNGAFEDDAASTNGLDAVPFELLHWDFGGFHPPTNCVRKAVELTGLKMKKDGLSFKYVEDLSHWGLAHTDYSGALACLFVCDKDGRWVGGKFDWISSSRRTRDFHNVYGGYNGWSLSNVSNPCPVAFVIVSKDGKTRSNVISGTWKR